MKIRCPECGRMGHLPDHLMSEAHRLRCWKCRASFATPDLAAKPTGTHRPEIEAWGGRPFDELVAGRAGEAPVPLAAEAFFAGFDESEPPSHQRGPGDSHYELSFRLDGVRSVVSIGWPEEAGRIEEPEAPSSDEIAVVAVAGPGQPVGRRGYDRFIDAWIRPLFFVGLGFLALTAILIGYLLVSSLAPESNPAPFLSTPALVIAAIGIIAFLLSGLSMVFLSILLAALAPSIRLNHADNARSAR